MSDLSNPFAPRQIRRVVMPLQLLVEYIDRRTRELTDARVHHAQVDEAGRILYLYIETAVGEPKPVDIDMDWNDMLGLSSCDVCGKPCPVENLTICKDALPVVQAALERGEFRCPNRMKALPDPPQPRKIPAEEL